LRQGAAATKRAFPDESPQAARFAGMSSASPSGLAADGSAPEPGPPAAADPPAEPTTLGLRQAVSTATYPRGPSDALRGNVLDARWDPALGELRGRVRGSGGQRYSTLARFTATSDGTGSFVDGSCSCPVRVDCKHVVALVLSAATGEEDGS